MKKSNAVLVLDAQSRAGTEVVQSLGRAGIPVDVVVDDAHALACRSRYPREVFVRRDGGPESLVSWLRETQAATRYRLIVTATESSLLAFQGMDDDDPLRMRALLPSRDSVAVALSKERTWQLACDLGIGVPQSRLLADPHDVPLPGSMPVVLKPVQSIVMANDEAMRLVPRIVRTAAERDEEVAKLLRVTQVQEQEYISGVGVGVECLYFAGQLIWHFVHERVHELPLTGGGSSYRKSIVPDAALVMSARRLLDALSWHGVAMVEFKRSRDGSFYLMEINPRLWGSLALAIDAGVDFPIGMWRLAMSEPPGPQPRYRVPYYTRHLVSDFNWLKENWRADPEDALLLTRPRVRSLLEYLRPCLLHESWDHFDWRDLSVTTAQVSALLRGNLAAVRGWLRRRALEGRLRAQHRRLTASLARSGATVRNVVFLCYGNICRSPFAEILGRGVLSDVLVSSAGFHSTEHRSTPLHVVRAARVLGVEMGAHRSRRVSEAMLAAADIVFVMDIDNYDRLLGEFPGYGDRVLALGLFAEGAPSSITDPYTASDADTKQVLSQIDQAIHAFARWRRVPLS